VAEPDPWRTLLLAALGPQNVAATSTDHDELVQAGDWLRAAGRSEDAVAAYRKALQDVSPYERLHEWATTTAKLSDALLASDAEEAIAVCRDALALVAPQELTDVLYFPAGRVTARLAGPPAWRATLFHQLAEGYSRRIEGDRESNLEVALRAYNQALADSDREADPVNWAVEALSLGNAYSSRQAGDRQENVAAAIRHQRDAFAVFAAEGDEDGIAKAATNFGVTLLMVEGEARAESAELAIEIFEQLLLRRREIDPLPWASATVSLANAYLKARDFLGATASARAVELFEDVLSEPLVRAAPGLHAEALHNLGLAYLALADDDPGSTNVKKAAAAFRTAIRVLPRAHSSRLRGDALRTLANLYFDRGRWAMAEPLFAEAIDAETPLLETAVYEAGRRAQLPSDLHPRYAYTLLRRGRYGEALVQLEAGKTRLLALALALTAARLEALDADLRDAIVRQREEIRELENLRADEQHREFSAGFDDTWFVGALAQAREELTRLLAAAREQRPSLDLDTLPLEDILALAPEEGAIVAPVFTSKGSAAIVIPHGTTRVTSEHVLRLDDFTTDDLNALLSKVARGREDAVEAVCAALWDPLISRIVRRARKLAARRIVLLPQGGLGLLPAHAAWRSRKGRRAYAAEEFEIAYAPSTYSLDTARRSAFGEGDALVVGVSRSERFGDLLSVPDEAQAVAALLGTEPLSESEATAAEILRRAPDAGCLHLACHGSFGTSSAALT
jgi:tetratricopeptide (TPR) repeat protein